MRDPDPPSPTAQPSQSPFNVHSGAYAPAPNVALMRSEHLQLRELIRVIEGTQDVNGFSGLVEQLCGMIDDHLELERRELAAFVPPHRTVDGWAHLTALGHLADDLRREVGLNSEVAREILDSHMRHFESDVGPLVEPE